MTPKIAWFSILTKEVQQSIRFFFETFHRTGSACAVVKSFRQQALLFPRRLKKGSRKGELLWASLEHSQALRVLHNPRYAGAFIYGRTKTRRKPDGAECWKKPAREQWILVSGMHPGYIEWELYETNQLRLRKNAHGSALSTHHYLHFIEPIRAAASQRFARRYGSLIAPPVSKKKGSLR
jgi:hypothetical protein